MNKIMIFGKNGQVGWELQRTLSLLGDVVAFDKEQADLGNRDQLAQLIRTHRPTLIVNAAAYTAVDQAEEDESNAMKINGTAPGIIAEEAKKLGALCVHYSTDYVFDGASAHPYVETDLTAPMNAYGRSKRAGEEAMVSVGGRFLIFRTSWVYGSRGKNFLLTMRRLGKEKSELKIVHDQIGAPTWSRHIAEATLCTAGKSIKETPSGIYHLTAGGTTSWHGFAEKIFSHRSLNDPYSAPKLIPIDAESYPSRVKRPKNSVLSNSKLHRTFEITLPPWETGLQLCLAGL